MLITEAWREYKIATSSESSSSKSSVELSSLSSSRLILKLGTPGGLEFDDRTVFPFGQLRERCPISLQLKHFPEASNSAFSLSLSLTLGFSKGLGVGLKL